MLNSTKSNSILPLIFILVISIVSSYLYPLCYNTDFSYHFNRLHALTEALHSQTFPNYMNYYVVNGYGYLVNFFYSDFLLLPFAFISLFSNSVIGYECLIFATTFFCGLFAYIAFNKIFKNSFGALIFAILYTTASYRIFDLYFRGALGETMAITFLPLVLWGVYEIIYGNSRKWYVLSIGFSLLIYSHAISTVIVFVILILVFGICCFHLIRKQNRFIHLCISVVVTLLLSAYFLVPYIEMILFDKYFFNEKYAFPFFVTYSPTYVLEGLFTMFRGRDVFFPKVGALVFFLAFFLRMFIQRKDNTCVKRLDLLLLLSLLLIVGNMYFSWGSHLYSKLLFIQMGSRFIPMASLILTFCSAFYLTLIIEKTVIKFQVSVFLLIMGLLVLYGDAYAYNNKICQNTEAIIKPVTGDAGIMFAEFLPENFPSNYTNFAEERGRYTIAYLNEGTEISNISKSKGSMTFDITPSQEELLELPLTYYKGYTIKENEKIIPYTKSKDGLIVINITDKGTVTTEFTGSIWVTISFYLTVLSFIVLFVYIFRQKSDIR